MVTARAPALTEKRPTRGAGTPDRSFRWGARALRQQSVVAHRRGCATLGFSPSVWVREVAVTPKRALIVDDSKSARVVLSRLLEKHDLTVDMRDSAEAALQYLVDHRPDVIFMDHVMSGMDGLSAVQAIKNDPTTASIPIMMYTSQDGEVYAGEARASGAAGVLPKQMAASDIAEVLRQLQVLPDRRESAIPSAAATFDQLQLPAVGPTRGALDGVVVPEQPATADVALVPVTPPLSAAEVRAIVEPLLQEQGIELRRFVVASLDGVSARLVAELEERLRRAVGELNATIAKATEPLPLPEPPRPTGWIVLAVVSLLAAAALGALVWQAHSDLAAARAIPAPVVVERATPVAEVDAPAPAVIAPVPPVRVAPFPSQRLTVAYGDAPLGPARLTALGNWLGELEKQGFAGVVRVRLSAGQFCLTGNPGEGYVPAPGELPANRCDVVGNPADDAQRAAEREPVAFTALASSVRERSHGAIDLRLVWMNSSGTAGYPPANDSTAAQWNTAAQARNVVEFLADPRAVTP